MYTFNNVEVVHIPDQTRLSDKAKDITLYTLTRNQSLGERLLTLRLHLVCESFKPKLKRVSIFYSLNYWATAHDITVNSKAVQTIQK